MSVPTQPQTGDLVLMARIPGGVCVFLREVLRCDTVLWEVLHPIEGLIQDDNYYFDIIDDYTHRNA